MKSFVTQKAAELGFCTVGITTADPVGDTLHLRDAIDGNRIGSMKWLARDVERRCDPKSLLPGATSVICLAYPYGESGIQTGTLPFCKGEKEGVDSDIHDLPHPNPPLTKGRGKGARRARYARGAEYHDFIEGKLGELWIAIRQKAPDARAKLCVDTSPILEKALAARAGLGWIGKNTILLNEKLGSWFMLGEIITDLELEPDDPVSERCGTCTKCIDACPTRALLAPRSLDAGRCISYLTTMSKVDIPDDLRPHIPEGTYGCDVCQEVCPYNNRNSLSA